MIPAPDFPGLDSGEGVASPTRPTVLGIDDEPGIRDSLHLELDDDFDVVTAASGPDALDLLSRRRIDAILLDLHMPEMDGEEVLELLRASGSRIPVVVLTVVTALSSVVRCMKLGANAYVTKPPEPGELAGTIEGVLRETRAAPGVLLVSDDPAALAPVKLALQSQVRVETTAVAAALQSDFPALAVVVHAPAGAGLPELAGVPLRFPSAEIVWVSADARDRPLSHGSGAPLNRLDLTLDHLRALLKLPAPRRCPSPAVMAAIDLMVRHCRDPLTIGEIARRVGVAEDHLGRPFREAFGWPAAIYYTRLRIEVACRLLRNSEEKVEQVAQQVGYGSAPNFSRAFKTVMGVRPGEFRSSRT